MFDTAIGRRLWIGVALVLGLVLMLSALRFIEPQEPMQRPSLGLMTTLPLQWSEGGIEADLAEDAKPHPAFERLAQNYEILPIDDFSVLSSTRPEILFLAQPRALAPAEMVKLDKWIRQGGRTLILADPALQWGSLYPLGDKRRPLFTSLLSPLFSHWEIEMVLPITDVQPITVREIGAWTIRTQTPGEWLPKPSSGLKACTILAKGLVADCRLGKGRAVIIADADLLDTAYWSGQGVRALSGSDEFANIQWIEQILLAIGKNQKLSGDFVGK